MLQRPLKKMPDSQVALLVPVGDPWTSHTTVATEAPWFQRSDLPILSDLPNFAAIPEDQLAVLLPQPLKDSFRLTQGYVRLVELARRIPPGQLAGVVDALRKSAAEVGLRSRFGAALAVLASTVEHCAEEDTILLRRFQKLQKLFEKFPAKDRDLLLTTLHELTHACQPLAE